MLVIVLTMGLTVAHYSLHILRLLNLVIKTVFDINLRFADTALLPAATLSLYNAPKLRSSIVCHHG
jgi:hypothetical protein